MHSGQDMSFGRAWEFLENSGWLAQRSAEIRRSLKAIARLERYRQGDYLYHSGEAADGVFGLVTGELDVEEPWIRISQHAFAELVALSEQSVRRALKNLEDQGLIETGYSRLRILDRDSLAAYCGFSGRR
jgi:CRP-like cAMP-binding protein